MAIVNVKFCERSKIKKCCITHYMGVCIDICHLLFQTRNLIFRNGKPLLNLLNWIMLEILVICGPVQNYIVYVCELQLTLIQASAVHGIWQVPHKSFPISTVGLVDKEAALRVRDFLVWLLLDSNKYEKFNCLSKLCVVPCHCRLPIRPPRN